LLLNFKAIQLTLSPDTTGERLQVMPEPMPANLELVNGIRLAGNGCGNWKDKLRADLVHDGRRWQLVLAGNYAASCGEHIWNLAVLPHAAYLRGVFETLWRELGGTWRGILRDGTVPTDARALATIESPTLAEMVRDINKYSNNVMARQLFLAVGSRDGHRPVTPENAETAVRAWLQIRGLDFPELVLDNGAGLSRIDRVSAGHLAQILRVAWRSPVMPEFVASLPLAAVDGTMKKRLIGEGMAGRAHLKTGTLSGVKAIAGYVLDKNDRMQIVVFLVNHANAWAAQPAQDALLDWVYYGAP
jgi:D-alanyl-D-alanine carboxypeptidase/D-alanyl-D-alanine-endopeptidase (penicillin-binding protein 4)